MSIDPRRFGPTRGELWFRLVFALAGLGLLGVAVAVRGFPAGLRWSRSAASPGCSWAAR